MGLSRKVKTALDENRLLILGAQVVFGFQLQAVFQEAFTELPSVSRDMNSVALALMALTIALLIAPLVVRGPIAAADARGQRAGHRQRAVSLAGRGPGRSAGMTTENGTSGIAAGLMTERSRGHAPA
jgi:hypothetical protein